MASLLVLCLPAAGQAFTDSRISEVMAGVGTGGDLTVQYVEIVMRSAGQNDVIGTRVGFFGFQGGICDDPNPLKNTFFSGSAELISGNVGDGSAGDHWVMATAGFAAAAGITPDFIIDGAMSQPDRYPCGMVCWGQPTTPSNASQYVDCVAYGGYHGTTTSGTIPAFVGTPTPLAPGDGTMSLTRICDTGNNATDFALMAPTPTNNAGQVGCFGAGCSATTTTTTPGGTTTTGIGTTSTTTTTFPPGVGETIGGTRLLLTTGKSAAKSALSLLGKDGGITLGSDPRQSGGGSVRVFTTAGDAFDHTYLLPASGWKPIGKPTAIKGYRFKNGAGPIKLVIVKRGKFVKAVGKGVQLVQSLAADPRPVNVDVAAGSERYCMSFGGSIAFKAGKKFLATNAPAPAACP